MIGAPSSAPSFVEPARARPARPALGRLSEFLLVGGITPLLFPLSWLLRSALSLDDAELAVGFSMFYAAYLINDPHFAVTYLLFYRDGRARAFGTAFNRRQRARYLVVGLVVPLLLAAWALTALATASAPLLGLLFQLMFLLVGFHYVKQGFGVLAVLAARRGVRFLARERAAILVHSYAGWAYAWASPADAGTEVEAKGVVYSTLAHPVGLEPLAQALFFVTLVPLVWTLTEKWRREGNLPLFTPLTAFLCSVWSWSIYSSVDPLVRYVIPALHSVQYLYMVWLLTRNEAREREREPWFETSVPARLTMLAASAVGLGWLLFHGAPEALDGLLAGAPERASMLGPTPYFAALFAFVNIHHYCMDAVIWRRDNPLTRYLHAPDELEPTADE